MDATKLHVLIVEDNPSDREIIRRGLETLNVDCTTYENGLQAVSTYKRNDFDGIILDKEYCQTGEFADAVRTCPNKHHIPIMLYSRQDQPKTLSALGMVVLFERNLHKTLGDFVNLLEDKHSG